MIRLGIDFDNTITNYDGVFSKVAVSENMIRKDTSHAFNTKADVKNYLININEEEKWTELQGLVYGKYIKFAKPQNNLIQTIKLLTESDIFLCIVSHRTKFPFIGEKTNLHDAARQWLNENLFQLISDTNIYFEETIENKVKRANSLNLDFFVDDLPKILLNEKLSKNITKILYKPEKSCKNNNLIEVQDWSEVGDIILNKI
jgi:5'(3')-deoxyribonucleotidase